MEDLLKYLASLSQSCSDINYCEIVTKLFTDMTDITINHLVSKLLTLAN